MMGHRFRSEIPYNGQYCYIRSLRERQTDCPVDEPCDDTTVSYVCDILSETTRNGNVAYISKACTWGQTVNWSGQHIITSGECANTYSASGSADITTSRYGILGAGYYHIDACSPTSRNSYTDLVEINFTTANGSCGIVGSFPGAIWRHNPDCESICHARYAGSGNYCYVSQNPASAVVDFSAQSVHCVDDVPNPSDPEQIDISWSLQLNRQGPLVSTGNDDGGVQKTSFDINIQNLEYCAGNMGTFNSVTNSTRTLQFDPNAAAWYFYDSSNGVLYWAWWAGSIAFDGTASSIGVAAKLIGAGALHQDICSEIASTPSFCSSGCSNMYFYGLITLASGWTGDNAMTNCSANGNLARLGNVVTSGL